MSVKKQEATSPGMPSTPEHPNTHSSDGSGDYPTTPTPRSPLGAHSAYILGLPPPLFRSVSPQIKIEASPPPLSAQERRQLAEWAETRTPPPRRRAPVLPPTPKRQRHHFLPEEALDPEGGRKLKAALQKAKPQKRPLAPALQELKEQMAERRR